MSRGVVGGWEAGLEAPENESGECDDLIVSVQYILECAWDKEGSLTRDCLEGDDLGKA